MEKLRANLCLTRPEKPLCLIILFIIEQLVNMSGPQPARASLPLLPAQLPLICQFQSFLFALTLYSDLFRVLFAFVTIEFYVSFYILCFGRLAPLWQKWAIPDNAFPSPACLAPSPSHVTFSLRLSPSAL